MVQKIIQYIMVYMNKKRVLNYIWFIPLISLIVQVLLVFFIDKMIPYKFEDVKGEQAFWIIYSFYAITLLIASYIYIGLVRRYKSHYLIISAISLIILVLIFSLVSYVLSQQDFVLTLLIIFAIQLCYSLPFHLGVNKCINQCIDC